MVAIRERKRKKTLDTIFLQANYLFRKQGVRQTTMEDIAFKAEVGVGTLYNYFQSKGDLVRALITDSAKEIHHRAEQLIHTDTESNNNLLIKTCELYTSFWKRYDKVFWQEIFIHSLQINQGLDSQFPLLNTVLKHQLENCIRISHQDIPDSDVAELSNFIYTLLFTEFTSYINDAGYSIDDLKTVLNKRIAYLINNKTEGA